ncbi:hypothetical protein IQ22_02825 [Pseudomonas duriflava]|uniref:Uncharacterized protein n=1 Tax=Pseudomonas duriflava TaxID=459528 RepID=A0A562Q9Z8_9PSED|nr:hypothetical protein [Pseudomonas duriflava]TWI52990.1 hypothetical protein IQ22_02825 [Pseudomonas duriflava]
MITYPKELPRPLMDGYDFQAVSPMVRSELQSGRARQRRAFTSVPTNATVKWLMNQSQAQYFEAWWEEILVSGTQWFDCPLSAPTGFQAYTARFTDIYQGPTPVTRGWWQFSATLELRKRPLLEPGWVIDAPEYIVGAPLFDLAMTREWPDSDYQTYMDVFDRAVNDKLPEA